MCGWKEPERVSVQSVEVRSTRPLSSSCEQATRSLARVRAGAFRLGNWTLASAKEQPAWRASEGAASQWSSSASTGAMGGVRPRQEGAALIVASGTDVAKVTVRLRDIGIYTEGAIIGPAAAVTCRCQLVSSGNQDRFSPLVRLSISLLILSLALG